MRVIRVGAVPKYSLHQSARRTHPAAPRTAQTKLPEQESVSHEASSFDVGFPSIVLYLATFEFRHASDSTLMSIHSAVAT